MTLARAKARGNVRRQDSYLHWDGSSSREYFQRARSFSTKDRARQRSPWQYSTRTNRRTRRSALVGALDASGVNQGLPRRWAMQDEYIKHLERTDIWPRS